MGFAKAVYQTFIICENNKMLVQLLQIFGQRKFVHKCLGGTAGSSLLLHGNI